MFPIKRKNLNPGVPRPLDNKGTFPSTKVKALPPENTNFFNNALLISDSSLWWALLFGSWCWCFHHSIDNITSIFLGLWRFFCLNNFHPNPRSIRPQRGSCCVGRGGWLFAWSWCERPSRGSSNPGPAGACCDRLGPRDEKSENEMHNTYFFWGWGGVDVSYCAKIGWMYLRADIAKLNK